MTEKKSESKDKGKSKTETLTSIIAALGGAALAKDIVAGLAPAAVEGLKVGFLGLGKDDEALYDTAKSRLTPLERTELGFFEQYIRREGYSWSHFRLSVAALEQYFKPNSSDDTEGPATRRLRQIIEKKTFPEKLFEAGDNLMKVAVAKKIDNGIQLLKTEAGELFVEFEGWKEGVMEKIEAAKKKATEDLVAFKNSSLSAGHQFAEDFAEDFSEPLFRRGKFKDRGLLFWLLSIFFSLLVLTTCVVILMF